MELTPDITKLSEDADKLTLEGKYLDAIEKYDTCLSSNPDNLNCIHGKANALMLSSLPNRFDAALLLYNRYLELEPDNPKIHHFKGNALSMIGKDKYPDAIESFSNCLRLIQIKKLQDKEEYKKLRYYALDHKAILFFYLQEFEKSAECFVENKTDIITIIPKLAIDESNNQININIEPANKVIRDMLALDINNYCYFNRIVSKDDHKRTDYISLYLCVLNIVSQLFVNNKYEMHVAHYTQIDIAKEILFNKSYLRMTSIAEANDKHEGETLLRYLGINSHNNNDNQAFITCFTFNHESLNQFRLYGKENQREASGVSLVLKNDMFEVGIEYGNFLNLENDEDNKISFIPLKNRFRCIYIDPKTEKVISIGHKDEQMFYREHKGSDEKMYEEYINYINIKLGYIKEGISNLKKMTKYQELEETTICDLLVELKYFVKHAAFKEEQECRIIAVENLKKNKKIEHSSDYSTMYLKYLEVKPNYLEMVYFGPTARGFNLFKDMCKLKGFEEVRVEKSDYPFK